MTFCYTVQIFYEDTDAAGVVYHANYIKYMERARTMFLEQKGLSIPTLIAEYGIQFLVKELKITYEKPARLGQQITVVTHIDKMGKASLRFTQNCYFDPEDPASIICAGEVLIVCTNLQFKPCGIPEPIVKELTA